MFLSFLTVTLNTIAIAHYNYVGTFLTDLTICYLGFTILKTIEEAEGWWDRLGYMFGGAIGAQFGIAIGHHFL